MISIEVLEQRQKAMKETQHTWPHSEYPLRKNGWTTAYYKERFFKQKGKCAICGKHSRKNRLSSDHEHTTPPKPRGLLCSSCNSMLGFAHDRPRLLNAGAAYLRFWKSK